jgi:predicted DNA-binding transcriptional regulator AlpA
LPTYLRKSEVAAALRVAERTLDDWRLKGKFPQPKRINGRLVWDAAVIQRFLAEEASGD